MMPSELLRAEGSKKLPGLGNGVQPPAVPTPAPYIWHEGGCHDAK